MLGAKPYHYIGANYWQGMNLGAPESGDRDRLCRELDQMQQAGITNLRILGASEGDQAMRFCIKPTLQTAPGVYNNDLWLGLDFLLDEMNKRDMKAVVVLGNFWTWSGGFAQYIRWNDHGDIPYPQEAPYSWWAYEEYTKMFFADTTAQAWYRDHIERVITRCNTISGVKYSDDPTIMSWQLANEPRGNDLPEAFNTWIAATADYIKSLDDNHLVSTGSEGNAVDAKAGLDVLRNHAHQSIDYVTMHIWAQNWRWFAPGDGDSAYQAMLEKVDHYVEAHQQAAKQLNKPLILEEFGLARNSVSYQPEASTTCRDEYYQAIFARLEASIQAGAPWQGANFWAYSGEGRPPRPGKYWKNGDMITADPPHELQGWYGIYNSDTSTLNVILNYNNSISKLNN